MKFSPRRPLPLGPLLRSYADAGPPGAEELGRLPELGSRFRAVLAAREEFLNETFVDSAGAEECQGALCRFYEATSPPALHASTLGRRAGMVRFALGHLLRGADPLPQKLEHCLVPGGPYHVAGLGPAFWSALLQGLDPLRNPAWTPGVVAGLRRLGLARWRTHDGPDKAYAGLLDTYRQLRSLSPTLTALHLDHFLTLVATSRGRDLFGGHHFRGFSPDASGIVQQERVRSPLRRHLRERGQTLEDARKRLENALAARDGAGIGAALSLADPNGCRSARLDWNASAEALASWVDRLWKAGDAYEALEAFWQADPIPGAGRWLPVAVLHLRDPLRFHLWDDACRQGYALLDDGAEFAATLAERYRIFNEGAECLRERHGLHPLEVQRVLAAVATERDPRDETGSPADGFAGFCADTFRFLRELGANNRRDWMARQRDRYHFAVRDPLVELCRALAERYVEPVLCREWGWDVETEPRSGRALTSVCKNDYGRSVPYNTALWITFYRRGWKGGAARRRDEAQFFVRLDAAGLSYGLCLGRDAREAGQVFRENVEEHAELLHRVLAENGALAECRFGMTEALSDSDEPKDEGPGMLRAWVAPKGRKRTGSTVSVATQLVAAKRVPAGSPLLSSDELVGDILITFDRLLPLYTCALGPGLHPILARHAMPGGDYSEADFRRATFVGDDWLRRAKMLLELKRQIILQGVPGTGKTHLARCLARLLTHGRDDAVRLVQFHPAYSYEEFVEGIKVRSVEVDGKHDVTYPVEDGLLCAFAAEAARRPAEPHVLIIDEINRGNLPRVFGELLYLLEYREQALNLPYSKRGFRLPANLYLIGTMNAADRSVALVDQALRRRFSFVAIAPDAGVLAAWLRARPPREGSAFADKVVSLFGRLNARLREEAGPSCQVGHSYFMVPDLDESRLRAVWEHQVGPLLDEYFAGQPGRAAAFDLDEMLAEGEGEPGRRKRRPAGVS